jgi:hypothetical protein
MASFPRKQGSSVGKRRTVQGLFGHEGAAGDAPGPGTKKQVRQGKHAMSNAVAPNSGGMGRTSKAGTRPKHWAQCKGKTASGRRCSLSDTHKGKHQYNSATTASWR